MENPINIIIGAGQQRLNGWISTQSNKFDVLNLEMMKKYLDNKPVDLFLSEHVWEHFFYEEGLLAAKNCYKLLKKGGNFRCAVPDGYFPNKDYQNIIKIGGPGPKDHPAYSHKIVFTYEILQKMFQIAGFNVELLEYCDKLGRFHYNQWNTDNGKIGRSLLYDTRNRSGKINMISIIIDATKI